MPFGWVSELLGSDRNHFDRIAHFSVGFYAYAAVEWMLRGGHCRYIAANAFGLLLVMGIAAAYEIIEWWYAVFEGGDAGIEFLGSQGDIWDAQKDMLADTLGAVCALLLYAVVRPDLHATTASQPKALPTQQQGDGPADLGNRTHRILPRHASPVLAAPSRGLGGFPAGWLAPRIAEVAVGLPRQ